MKKTNYKLYYIILRIMLLCLLPVGSFAQWDWQTCSNWAYKIYDNYMVRNNIWGQNQPGGGSQCIYANSESYWHISATHQNGTGMVKGYPQAVRGWVQGGIGNTYPDGSPSPMATDDHGLEMRIDELTKFDIYHNMSLPASGRYMVLYDMYMFYEESPGLPYEQNKPDQLIMLFTAMHDDTGWLYSDAEQYPVVTIGDRQWRLRGPDPSGIVNEVRYILYPYPDWIIEEMNLDYLEILHYLQDNRGLPGNLRISTVQVGVEPIEGGEYTINEFWVDISVEDEDPVAVTGVSVSPSSISIDEGSTGQLTATVEPSNATNNDVTWDSSNESVATVDENGKVTGIAPGNTTITVTTVDGGFTDQCLVEVVEAVTYTLTVNNGIGSGNYSEKTVVDITADAAPEGQQFAQWTGDVVNVTNVNSASTTLTMPASNVTVTATYEQIPDDPVQAGVISSAAGAEQAGNVKENAYDGNASTRWANDGTVNNAWIELTLDGVHDLENIEVLFFNGNSRTYLLNISLNGSSIWSGNTSMTSGYWTQSLSGTGDVLRISMTGNNSDGSGWLSIYDIRINGFPVSLEQYTLTVNSGSGSGNYTAGTVVNIIADDAPSGEQFAAWTGDVANIADVNSASTTVTMPASDITVTATFEEIPPVETYALTVNSGGGSGDYEEGTVVNIAADTAPSGQQFAQWTGDVANVADVNSASTTLTMPASNVTLTATYELIPDDPVQAGIISSAAGAEQTGNVKENAYDGNASTRWANDGTVNNAWIELTLNGVYVLENIEVLFFNGNSRTYPLNISLNGSSIWSGNTSMTSGYWTQSLSGTGDVLRISMTGNNSDGSGWLSIYDIRINGFPVSLEQYTLTVNSGSGSGNYPAGTVVNITADAAPSGQQFAQWTGDVAYVDNVNSASTTLTMPASDITVTATYEDIPEVTNLLTNGDFSDELAGWNFMTNGANASASIVNGEAVINISSAGSATWQPQLVQSGFVLQAGQEYQVNFDARAASNRNIELYINSGPNNYSEYLRQNVSLTSNMQSFSYTFTAPSNDDNARIDFNCGGNNANVILDNVSIILTEQDKSALLPTSIAEKSLEKVSIFPNPVKYGLLNINLSDLNYAEAQIYDLMGRFVLSAKLTQSSNTLNIDKLQSGIYILKLNCNHETITRRLVIE